MKYHRLTAEQLYEMHHEFSVFLATQGIDKEQWDYIKNFTPEKVYYYLDEFSEVVWFTMISQCNYLEFCTSNYLYLFSTRKEKAEVFVLNVSHSSCDLTSDEGFKWALKHLQTDAVELLQSEKVYHLNREDFIYEYLRKGATFSDGKRFNAVKSYFSISSK